jgi:hypothetical protein
MRPAEIEAWARSVIDQVAGNQPIEDVRVELKSAWIDPVKAARRLAAHANTAQGANLLWLIGVDEKRGVIGADFNELSDWYPKVRSSFDELTPEVTPLNVPTPSGMVVALLFQTDRVPYVVKNPQEGVTQFEVPWRDGNSTRSAHRSELLRLLVPLQNLPALELMQATLDVGDEMAILGEEATGKGLGWIFEATLYVVPANELRIVVPGHRSGVSIRFEDSSQILESVSLGFRLREEPLIMAASHQAVIRGPGLLKVHATVRGLQVLDIPHGYGWLTVRLGLAGSDLSAVAAGKMRKHPISAPHHYRWVLYPFPPQ